MKAKNKVLLSSIASIALCSSIAVGGTFALFTSESKVNVAVTSGKVNVVASIDETTLTTWSMGDQQEAGKFENGGTAVLAGNKLTLTNVTPGDKAEFVVDIANNSNIDIQYKVTFDVSGGLADVLVCDAEDTDKWIDVAADAEIPSVTVTVELPETVGNEYQNVLDTVITVKVEAVQGNAFTASASTNAELDAAIKNGKTEIVLGSGNYIIPDSAKGKTLTIIGNGDTVIATQDDGSYEGCDYSLDGSTVTFENITINTTSKTYTGYARLNATYNNCTINGTYTLYGNSEFNNCTFNVSGDVYNLWTWGAPNATFNKCTFNSDGKALLLYGQANTNLTVNDCVFNDKGNLDVLKAAIEIGNDYNKSYTLTVNNTTVNGYAVNTAGIPTGSTLWANKNSMGTDKLNVVVDGVDVY